jgi:hypothetical protein
LVILLELLVELVVVAVAEPVLPEVPVALEDN